MSRFGDRPCPCRGILSKLGSRRSLTRTHRNITRWHDQFGRGADHLIYNGEFSAANVLMDVDEMAGYTHYAVCRSVWMRC
jgi:hypothetical protein